MPDDIDGAAKYTIHDAKDARERFLCAGEGWTDGKRGGQVQGAISYPAGSMSAYKFVIGVLKMSLEKGLKLFTHTPALKLGKYGHTNDWIVETPRGSIRAKRVVLATNAYTGYLCSEFKGSIVPLRGQITAQRPGRNMPQKGLRETYSFVYEKGYDYMISRQEGAKFEGDIVIGGGWTIAQGEGLAETGISNDDEINEDISAYLRDSMERVFGENWGDDHEDGRVRREWTGIMGNFPSIELL
jgi:glycine/D-amino acid oxidase-like deaminating enzyme